MKQIQTTEVGGPEVMHLQEVASPRAGEGQVVFAAKAIGVNPVDTYLRAGLNQYSPVFPWTPGFDAAGVVTEVGAGVSHLHIGQRVYCAGSISGTYGEQVLCSGDQVYALPESLSFDEGACLGIPAATACLALDRLATNTTRHVLIHGASGGVGLAAVQIAKARGWLVAATAGTEKGRQLVVSVGADWVFDHNDSEHIAALLEQVPGGVDGVVEMLANVSLGQVLPALAPSGCAVVVGSRGEATINPRDLMSRGASVCGVSLFLATKQQLASVHQRLAILAESGALRPVVRERIPLAEAGRAHQQVMSSGASGNFVLFPELPDSSSV